MTRNRIGNGATAPAYLIGYTGGKRFSHSKSEFAFKFFGYRNNSNSFLCLTYIPCFNSPCGWGLRYKSNTRSVRSFTYQPSIFGGR